MRYDQETIKFRTPSLWTNSPEEYKLANSLTFLKEQEMRNMHLPVMQNF